MDYRKGFKTRLQLSRSRKSRKYLVNNFKSKKVLAEDKIDRNNAVSHSDSDCSQSVDKISINEPDAQWSECSKTWPKVEKVKVVIFI